MKLDRQKITTVTAVSLIIVLASLSAFEFLELSSAPIRVACVGDSITVSSQYPVDLWQSLGANYIVGDFGSGGAAVSQITNMSYIHQVAFGVAMKFNPDIVIIMLGTNDAYTTFSENDSDFIADYVTLISEFQSLSTKPTVYLVEPPPIYNNTVYLSNDILVQQVIPNIVQVASQTHSHLINAYKPLVNRVDLFVDGIHPSADGAKVIADTIYAAVSSNK
jgi:lysophospholipase L1-like esterase